ncbi:50S ribosomal protein L24 [Candidatus Fermentibacterales bacterium]|nr:50S ribosomal protein L24 [Candidatus Fermentibacterales bacterium]
MRVRRGDRVLVLTGNEKGKKGKVLKVFRSKDTAIVEGLNFMKRHTRPSSKNQQGGILEKEAPMRLSNLAVICSECGEAKGFLTRRDGEGKPYRLCKSCGETIREG